VVELLLKSDHLMLASEDDTFALVTAWAHAQSTFEREAAIDRLVRCLRLHHMSPIFLTSVVANHTCVTRERSGLGFPRVLGALAYQSIAPSLSHCEVTLGRSSTSRLETYKPSRAPKDPPAYLLEVETSLADCVALRGGKAFFTMLGVAGGYRLSVTISRRSTVRLAVCLKVLGISAYQAGGLGPITRLKVCASEVEQWVTSLLPVESSYPWDDFFGKP
jgi:hypothetical protein